MTALSAKRGYPSVSIAEVSAHAGVSSATFYEQFEDKEDCLLAAYRAAAERVRGGLDSLPDEQRWPDSSRTALGSLLHAVEEDPDGARLVLVEALAGGSRLREERDRVIAAFLGRTGELLDDAERDGTSIDLPADLVLGAVRSVVSHQLSTHQEDRLAPLVEGLIGWIESYAVPAGEPHWSSGPGAQLPAEVAERWVAALPAIVPERLPRGRHRLPAAAVARIQRNRIMYGTTEAVLAKGYANTTIADIVAAAGISRDVFYAYFPGKEAAYLAAQSYGTQELFEACSAAYFAGGTWPERVWLALQALVIAIASNPGLSHLRVVECYAAGSAAIEETEQLKRAATIFLQEGYRTSPRAGQLPWLWAHAIVGSVFESFYGEVSRGQVAQLPRQLPLFTYVAIAPFIGHAEAVAAVEELSDRARGGAARRRSRAAAARAASASISAPDD